MFIESISRNPTGGQYYVRAEAPRVMAAEICISFNVIIIFNKIMSFHHIFNQGAITKGCRSVPLQIAIYASIVNFKLYK